MELPIEIIQRYKTFISGDIALINADCLEILPTLAAVSVDAVITDPPYDIVATGGGIGAKRQYLKDIVGFTDTGFDPSIISNYKNWMVFCSAKQLPNMFNYVGDRRWMIITWNKPNPTPLTNGNYLPDTEYIFHCWSAGNLYGEYKDKSRFIVYPAKQDLLHPNEKPIRVINKLIRNASDKNHLILDPFMGSGTTGVACVQTGRKFIGIEIDQHYFDIAVKRIKEAQLQIRMEI